MQRARQELVNFSTVKIHLKIKDIPSKSEHIFDKFWILGLRRAWGLRNIQLFFQGVCKLDIMSINYAQEAVLTIGDER